MLIPLLFIATQLTTANFTATDMACWVTPNFFQSQPLAIYADIPQNATAITLSVSQGRGDYYAYKLHSCSYPACTNFNYFRNNCPLLATLGFGTTDITNLLAAGASYGLYIHGLPDSGYSSTAISGALLTVYFPVLYFNATDKQCIYHANETACTANVYSQGSGQCFYPSAAANASVFNASGAVSSTSNGTHVLWNCSTGNYSLNFNYLPISSSQTWQFTNSNLSRQQLLSTLNLSNPNNDSFTNVPFLFNSSFDLESGEESGTVNLSRSESRLLNATFSTAAISYSLSFSPIAFNFSTSSMLANLTIEKNFLAATPFSFSTNDLPLGSLNCTEDNFTLYSGGNFSIPCSPLVNYSLSNWTGINATLISTFLAIFSPQNLTVAVYNLSSRASQIFQQEVSTSPDSFTYVSPGQINLTSDFLTIGLSNSSTTESEELNYSISLANPIRLPLSIPLQLNFSNYLNVSLTAGALLCPDVLCIENKVLTATISNQTNFSLVAFKPLALLSTASTASTSSIQPIIPTAQFPAGAAPSSTSQASTQGTAEQRDVFSQDSALGFTPPPEQSARTGEPNTNSFPTPIGQAESSPASGFFTAIPSAILFAPFALLFLLGSFVVLKKPPLVKRSFKNGKTAIAVSNPFSSELKKLVVTELVPLTAQVQSQGKTKRSAIGKVITWKKPALKKSEKWQVGYVSNVPAKKGKLCFMQNGKKVEKLF